MNALQRVVVSAFCFCWVQWGERESDSSNDMLSFFVSSFRFFFCLLPYIPPHRPYAGFCFLFFVLFLSVKQQLFLFMVSCPCHNNSYLLYVVLSVQQVSVPGCQVVKCCCAVPPCPWEIGLARHEKKKMSGLPHTPFSPPAPFWAAGQKICVGLYSAEGEKKWGFFSPEANFFWGIFLWYFRQFHAGFLCGFPSWGN